MTASPPPQGMYVATKRHGNLVFTAGMTPRPDGCLAYAGRIGAADDVERDEAAVVRATVNALAAVGSLVSQQERIATILSLTVFKAVDDGFAQHSRIADHASRHLHAVLGEKGIGCRAAIGVWALPGNALVEIQLVAAVETIAA